MPNARREGQTLIGFQADEELVRLIESARKRTNRRGVEPFTKFGNASVVTSLNEDSSPSPALPPRRPVSYKDAHKTKPRKLKRP